jgi:hypothetical protein
MLALLFKVEHVAESAIGSGERIQRIVDLDALGLRKGNDADAEAFLAD